MEDGGESGREGLMSAAGGEESEERNALAQHLLLETRSRLLRVVADGVESLLELRRLAMEED